MSERIIRLLLLGSHEMYQKELFVSHEICQKELLLGSHEMCQKGLFHCHY